MKDAIVILGGGLAGLTAAIHLSKLGHCVSVIEKNTYPKHKVCGEYISNEVVDYFKWLDLETVFHQAQPITDFKLALSASHLAQVQLPLGGFGISRYLLDDVLYRKAKAQNCVFIHDVFTKIDFQNEVFSITLQSGAILESKIVLGAFGKRSTIDLQLKRSFIQKKSHWMAVKAHYKGNFPNEMVGLFPFEGGYCGVSKVENNRINVCYLVKTTIFKKYKNSSEFEKNVLHRNQGLSEVLSTSESCFDKPLAISQISFLPKQAVENHVLMLGDAAGLIHPLCGNGMAMAIHSAKIASELIHLSLQETNLNRNKLEESYIKAWNKTFKNRLTMGQLLSKILLNPKLTTLVLKTIARSPRFLQWMIKKTHGKPISISSL